MQIVVHYNIIRLFEQTYVNSVMKSCPLVCLISLVTYITYSVELTIEDIFTTIYYEYNYFIIFLNNIKYCIYMNK